MKLSIIITTRNRYEDLLRLVHSIFQCSRMDFKWEILIVDNGSDDSTKNLTAEKISGIPNVKIIHNRQQEMMVKSRNIGARKAKGKYILFIDDDNIVENRMIEYLIKAMEKYPRLGITGPSMYYLNTKEKYLDCQKINLATGRTRGIVSQTQKVMVRSDGIPNAFLIRKKVFEECGFFDESLIQTFTEPDFSYSARKRGWKTVINKNAKIYHDIEVESDLAPRALGGMFNQKAYCLMRNRSVIVSRYGTFTEKLIYLIFFSWLWPSVYSLLMLRHGRFDLIKLYWMGFWDGIVYFFTGHLSDKKLMKLKA